MRRKRKVVSTFGTGAVALALLGAFSAQTLRPEPAFKALAVPSAYSLTCKDTISLYTRPKPALVDEETANVGPDNTSPTEIDFEPLNPNDRPAILIPKEPPRDNPTPELSPPQTTATVTATELKMGDTRIVDGQKQVYFLGFGWIEDNDEPNVGIFIGGDGDITKMVGMMG